MSRGGISREGRELAVAYGLSGGYAAARDALVGLAAAADAIEDEVQAWELAFGCETPAAATARLPEPGGAVLWTPRVQEDLDAASVTEPAPPFAATIPAVRRWAWGLTEELSGGLEDSREDAIRVAREQAEDDGEPGATVYVCGDLDDPGSYAPDVDHIIEAMSESAYHDTPEDWSGGEWPAPSPAARAELEALLEPIRAWARRHCPTSWWTVVGPVEAVPPEACPGCGTADGECRCAVHAPEAP